MNTNQNNGSLLCINALAGLRLCKCPSDETARYEKYPVKSELQLRRDGLALVLASL